MYSSSRDDNYATKVLGYLRCNQHEIVQDLEVHHVIPYLLNGLILTLDDKERIENEVTSKDKAQKLLNIVLKKATLQPDYEASLNILNVFIESLNDKYSWLYEKLTSVNLNDQDVLDGYDVDDDEFESSNSSNGIDDKKKIQSFLESGGVQNLPVVTVKRKELLSKIRKELTCLERGQFIVIQGMAGTGKTISAIHALHNTELLKNSFSDGVFMLSIGKECSDCKDGILNKMRILCDKIGESRAPSSVEHGTELLRARFFQLPKSLLILDSVWRPEVIRAFDIGCAILVTTRDLSVMDVVAGRTQEILLVQETSTGGFSLPESLELFKMSLGFQSIDELPHAATAIHQTSKGSPMVISLISSLLSDHKKDNSLDDGRWNYYLDSLRKRKYSKMRKTRDYEHESIFDAISLSYDHLNENQKKYYLDLSIFQDDVRIPCPVLEILWKLNRYEVEDIMKEFVRKSLIVEEKNPSRNWFVYYVNGLQLDYLKYQLRVQENSDDAEKKLHQKLVVRYMDYCESEWDKLPDDDYTYFYLGYHFYKAEMHDMFPVVYLNLLFLGQKIRLTGPADLLVDIRKYHGFIANSENVELIEEIQEFAQILGHKIYAQADVDIIQLLLENSNFQLLYKLAMDYAKLQPKKLYLEWINNDIKEWKRPERTTICSDSVRSLKFVGNIGNLFVGGLNTGNLELCDLVSGRICNIFTGHSGTVYSLDIYRSSALLLSASEDGTCKLWDLSTIIRNIESNSPENKHTATKRSQDSPSPKLCIDKWNYPSEEDQSLRSFNCHTAPVKCARFSPDGTKIISISMNELLLWCTANVQILQNYPHSSSFQSLIIPQCHFASSSNQYFFASLGTSLMFYSQNTDESSSIIEAHNMNIVSIFMSTQKPQNLVTVSENAIGIWNVDLISIDEPRRKSLSPRKSFNISKIFGCTRTFNDSKNSAGTSNSLKVPDSDVTGSRKPSVSKSDIVTYASSPVKTLLVPVNKLQTMQVSRCDTITKITAGLFQCATIAVTIEVELIACGTSDRKICLYNLTKRQIVGEFSNQSGWIHCLEFSPIDDWTLLSGSDDHTVMLWDVENEIGEIQHSPKLGPHFAIKYVNGVGDAKSNEGYFKSVFSTDSNTIQIYKDTKLESEYALPNATDENISSIGISTCGKEVVYGTSCGKVYEIKDKTVELFCDVLEQIEKFVFNSTGEYVALVLSNGDALISKQFTNLWQIHQSTPENSAIVDIHFAYENSVAIVFTNNPGSMVLLQEICLPKTNLKGLEKIDRFESEIMCSTLSNDSKHLAIGTSNDGIILGSLVDGIGIVEHSILSCNHGSAITTLKFSPDGNKLAVGHSNGLITIWNKEYENFTEKLNLVHHKGPVRHFLFPPLELTDKPWLVSNGDKLGFWSLEKPITMDQIPKPSFMSERRRKKSGDSRPSSRLSIDIPLGLKIGKQGKRELLQSFLFLGNSYSSKVASDPSFTKFVTLDDNGIFYFLETINFAHDQNYN